MGKSRVNCRQYPLSLENSAFPEGVSGWARPLAIQVTASLKQNFNQWSAVSPSHLIARKTGKKKKILQLWVCQVQVCSKRTWNLQRKCCQREGKQFLPEQGVWVAISCSGQLLHSFRSGHLDFKCHSVMSSVWGGHLLILPPHIHSPFFGNKTPITIGASMCPGLGDRGADLAKVWHSVSPATGAGSGGHGAWWEKQK